ncbi:MAG: hypothetical protein K2X28_04330 [Alphaproteobacteria bacterium]|nr:hypothetical protein [Alphaproteobacteria bacterium]
MKKMNIMSLCTLCTFTAVQTAQAVDCLKFVKEYEHAYKNGDAGCGYNMDIGHKSSYPLFPKKDQSKGCEFDNIELYGEYKDKKECH